MIAALHGLMGGQHPLAEFFPVMEGWYENRPNSMTINGSNQITQWNDRSKKGRHLVQSTLPGTTLPTWDAGKKAAIFSATSKSMMIATGYTDIDVNTIVAYFSITRPASDFSGVIGGTASYGFLLYFNGYYHAGTGTLFGSNIRVNSIAATPMPNNEYATVAGWDTSGLNRGFGDTMYLGRGDEETRYATMEMKGLVVLSSIATTAQILKIENYLKGL